MATGGLSGFAAKLHKWNETGGTTTLAHTLPLSPLGDGVVRGERRMNETGVYLVEILLDTATVPGGGYNLTVIPGPPSASESAMQVRAVHNPPKHRRGAQPAAVHNPRCTMRRSTAAIEQL